MKENLIKNLRDESVKWMSIKEMIDSPELDVQTLLDTLEGETEVNELILKIEEEIAERDLMIDAIEARIKDLRERKNRIDKTSGTLRECITSVMDKCGIRKIDGALATISLKNTPPKVIIVDESLIPVEFFKTEVVLDKEKINKFVKEEGCNLEGVTLTNGGITVQIRRK